MRAYLMGAIVLLMIACSGGGESSDIAATPPDIVRVSVVDAFGYAPGSFYVGEAVYLEVSASDPDLDIAGIWVEFHFNDRSMNRLWVDFPAQAAGVVEYSMQDSVEISGPAGDWLACFMLVDDAGLESAERCLAIRVEGGILVHMSSGNNL